MQFVKLLRLLVAVGFLAGCSSIPSKESTQPNSGNQGEAKAETAAPTLTLDELRPLVEILNYEFAAGDSPTVSLVLLNRKPADTLALEIATEFRKADGSVADRTTWTPVALAPSGRHGYVAATTDKTAASAVLLVRKAAR